jgi:hypothetical protein
VVDAHRLAEERSIALHAAVAERLRADPRLLDRARARVQGWLAHGPVHPRYARAWAELLARPLEEVCAAIVDPGERARALRQSTPFAGVIDARTRWRIWRQVRARLERAA